jgi:phenylacetate-CoA ligase
MSLTHQLYLQRIRENENLDKERFDRYRAPVVARLLDHAWGAVPFYRDRLAPLVQGGGFDMADWFSIPLLHPGEFEKSAGRMVAAALPKPMTEVEDVASNSFVRTAQRSRLSRVAAECERERFYERNEVELSGMLAIIEADGGSAEGTGWSITFDRSKWIALDGSVGGASRRAWLAATGARHLRTSLKAAEALAADGKLEAIDLVIIAGDELPEASREKLASALQARIVHLVERPVVGLCAADRGRSQGYLVPAASNIVEIVDRFGLPTAPGEVGQLVITPLYEYACPLLRLATGISAVASVDPGTSLGVRSLARIAGPVSE